MTAGEFLCLLLLMPMPMSYVLANVSYRFLWAVEPMWSCSRYFVTVRLEINIPSCCSFSEILMSERGAFLSSVRTISLIRSLAVKADTVYPSACFREAEKKCLSSKSPQGVIIYL